jgi:hypothetical protein
VGYTPEPQRIFHSSAEDRGLLKLSVFINLVTGVQIPELTGTKVWGPPLNLGYKVAGKGAKTLTKDQYMDSAWRAAQHCMEHGPAFRKLEPLRALSTWCTAGQQPTPPSQSLAAHGPICLTHLILQTSCPWNMSHLALQNRSWMAEPRV